MFSPVNKRGSSDSSAIWRLLDQIKPHCSHLKDLIQRPGCGAQRRSLRDIGFLTCFEKGGCNLSNVTDTQRGEKTGERGQEYDIIIFRAPKLLIHASTERKPGVSLNRQRSRQHTHQRHLCFQAPWQQKQQYQKVRNSFLQDRRGGTAGTLIGSVACCYCCWHNEDGQCALGQEIFTANSS